MRKYSRQDWPTPKPKRLEGSGERLTRAALTRLLPVSRFSFRCCF